LLRNPVQVIIGTKIEEVPLRHIGRDQVVSGKRSEAEEEKTA